MGQFFPSFLVVTTAAVSLTFGGMVVMSHGVGMMLPDDHCMTGSCATSHAGGMDGVTCLSHCIQAATVHSIVPISASAHTPVLFFAAIFFVSLFAANTVSRFFRSDNPIGKLLLQRQLSTVIIRD